MNSRPELAPLRKRRIEEAALDQVCTTVQFSTMCSTTDAKESMTDAKTAIAEATADAVTVRGHDLTSELMGHLSLTEMFFLLLMGRAPDERERRMTDACLVAIAEHGLVPSVQAARMTLSSRPESLQGAVAPACWAAAR